MTMTKRIRILGARRAYEFKQDDLRLSYLSQPSVIERVKLAFGFQIGQVGSPHPTFGQPPPTLPPGVVFDFGTCEVDGGIHVPVRFIHFEARRIVIDVAGPTAVIAPVYDRLRALLREDVTLDGSPVIPDHAFIQEYSELTVQLPQSVDRLFNPVVVSLAKEALAPEGLAQGQVLAPVLQFRIQQVDQEFPRGVDTYAMLRI
jgi:hypothetical protein